MRKIMTRAPVAGLALLLALAGCDKRQDEAHLPAGSDSSRLGQAMVRVVNAAVDAPAVNIRADEADAFTAVEFKTVTPYQAVSDNFVTFKLIPASPATTDSTAPLAENREMMDAGDRYTIVVVPGEKPDDHPTLMVLEEASAPGDSAKARIRVVNAARGVKEFDVFVPGQTEALVGDVNFDSEAGYQDVDSRTGALQIRVHDSPLVLLDIPSRSWEAGHSYTIVVTNKGSTGRQQGALDAIVVEDPGSAE